MRKKTALGISQNRRCNMSIDYSESKALLRAVTQASPENYRQKLVDGYDCSGVVVTVFVITVDAVGPRRDAGDSWIVVLCIWYYIRWYVNQFRGRR